MSEAKLIEEIHALLALQNETPRIPNLARQLLDEAASAIRSLAARASALEEALKPFAMEVGRFGRGNEDRVVEMTIADRKAHPAVDLSVGDFVRARTALTGGQTNG